MLVDMRIFLSFYSFLLRFVLDKASSVVTRLPMSDAKTISQPHRFLNLILRVRERRADQTWSPVDLDVQQCYSLAMTWISQLLLLWDRDGMPWGL